jgi:oligopeptidase B
MDLQAAPDTRRLTAPPVAKRIANATEIHGERLADDYAWLRDKSNPDVALYLQAENAYAQAALAPTKALQHELYDEMLSRIKETDVSVPCREGAYYWYSRTEKGKQYPILCRRRETHGPEEITLDVNELAAGQPFMALGAYAPSDDGRLLAYSTDNTGFRQYTLHVKDLETGELLSERSEKTGSIVWAADGTTLFYTVEDAAKRDYRLYRHRLGEQHDALIYEERDEMFNLGAHRSRSRAYIFLDSHSHTTSEVRYLRADQPDGDWTLVAERVPEHEYMVADHGDQFYIRSNDAGRNFRIVTAPVADPGRENWLEVVAHRGEVMLGAIELFAHHYVLWELEGGLPHFRITDLRTNESHRVAFPEPVYAAFPSANRTWDTSRFRYDYQSLVTPESVFDYDMQSREMTLLKQKEVLGGYDRSRYASERIFAAASDGARVPMSLVYRSDTARDGSAPAHLIAYGSYGYPYPITFDSNRLSLLDRGFVFAVAHIRGGGEMGKRWHDEGRMAAKMNTFTDFIAAAETLIERRYTSSDRLSIEGGSAGGLLMGAVANLRPDLFGAIVSHVPFVDVLNTMLDATLPLTVAEYEEWGNPNIKEQYDVMRAYSPYDNLEAKAYPSMLVKTSFNDSQVMYWEPAKYVAKLRTLKTGDSPLLLITNMAAGHGGASGRYDRLREIALDYAFILTQSGSVGRSRKTTL